MFEYTFTNIKSNLKAQIMLMSMALQHSSCVLAQIGVALQKLVTICVTSSLVKYYGVHKLKTIFWSR